MELRHFIELNLRLKFKGCNHPTRRLLNRPQRQNTNPDFRLEPLESATSSKQTSKSKERSLGSSLERRQVQRNKVVNFRDNRSSSMTQLPNIRNSRNNAVREHRQRFATVFENHRKSLIQHCERSELRLHFEWTKVN